MGGRVTGFLAGLLLSSRLGALATSLRPSAQQAVQPRQRCHHQERQPDEIAYAATPWDSRPKYYPTCRRFHHLAAERVEARRFGRAPRYCCGRRQLSVMGSVTALGMAFLP